jgi:hypothetical protein
MKKLMPHKKEVTKRPINAVSDFLFVTIPVHFGIKKRAGATFSAIRKMM